MAIRKIEVGCFEIPTATPESDGTLEWRSTILVTVHVHGGNQTGFGYTYSHRAAAVVAQQTLSPIVVGSDEFDVGRNWMRMLKAVRNLGSEGIVSCAIAAVDCALWDLKAKILNVPLVKLWGAVRDSIPVYGSGGFTSYSIAQLQQQLGAWAEGGIEMVKMKVGTHPEDDCGRVRSAREVIGQKAALFVDANGAYSRKQALRLADEFSNFNVTWFEEPVSSDDLEGLRLIRDRAPSGMAIAAGEYGFNEFYFQRMIASGAVDVLQADATRCMGLTGFMKIAALCDANGIPLSAHTAPTIHAHACCAADRAVHLEYFFDHSRIEHMLFEGALSPVNGALTPDLSRPGLGVEFKHQDARKFQV